MKFQHLRIAMAAGFVFALLAPFAAAKTPEEIFVQVSPSVVVVDIFDVEGKPIGQGSGVVIGAGQVITNCHVAQKGKRVEVWQSGKIFEATVQYADPDRDLCQLSVPDLQAPPATLGTAKELRVDQRVYAIGAQNGVQLSLTEGLVSNLRSYEGSQYIQTSAKISPGSNGGGLFDNQGRLVGVTTLYLAKGQSLNFALPVEWIGELPKRARLTPVAVRKGGLDWLNRAAVLEQKGDWQGLLKSMQQWVKSEPKSAIAWNSLGIANSKLKQYGQAIKAYRNVLRIEPENAEAWYKLANAYDELKQYDQEIEAYREALLIQPEKADTWFSLGFPYLCLERYEQAINAYQEALRIQPNDASAWCCLGIAHSLLKQYDQAIEAYREALRIKPKDADTWYLLGNAHKTLKQYDEAIKAYREALHIQSEPEKANTWYNLGLAYQNLKQYDQAIEAYREAVRIQPENANTWDNLGFAYHNLKQYDEAIEAYREAVRIQPEMANTWYNLGLAYYSHGQRDEVREIHAILRKLNPGMAERYYKAIILPNRFMPPGLKSVLAWDGAMPSHGSSSCKPALITWWKAT